MEPIYSIELQQDGSWAIIRTEPYAFPIDPKHGNKAQKTFYRLGLTEEQARDVLAAGISNDSHSILQATDNKQDKSENIS